MSLEANGKVNKVGPVSDLFERDMDLLKVDGVMTGKQLEQRKRTSSVTAHQAAHRESDISARRCCLAPVLLSFPGLRLSDHRWKLEDEACGGRAREREMGSMGDRPLAPLK